MNLGSSSVTDSRSPAILRLGLTGHLEGTMNGMFLRLVDLLG